MNRTFVQRLCRSLVSVLYRDVAVRHVGSVVHPGPQISVSNHFGGFADALILIAVLPRMPRIIARDVIWRIPVVGWLMRRLRAIPVHKREDGDGDNSAMFASCFAALADGDHVLLFPEGITRNEPSIGPVKTGAARIAIGAVECGVEGIVIRPIGIHYEDKATIRSRVSVQVGGGLPVTGSQSTGVDGVHALTDRIDRGLRDVAPDFADWDEAAALTTAAEVVLRSAAREGEAVSVAGRDRLASLLDDRCDESRRRVADAANRYRSGLDALGVGDATFEHRRAGGQVGRGVLLDALVALMILPFAIVGFVVSAIPAAIVFLVGRLRLSPSVLATVKPLLAIATFGITWAVVAWRIGGSYGVSGVAAVLLLMPVYLAAAIIMIERCSSAFAALREWRKRGTRGSLADRVASDRQAVVDAVADAF